MIMHISYRDMLYKQAENPNKYPWNKSDHSKDEDNGNPEQISSPPENGQKMINIKMDKKRLEVSPDDIHYMNWEMLNQLGSDVTPNYDANSDQARSI